MAHKSMKKINSFLEDLLSSFDIVTIKHWQLEDKLPKFILLNYGRLHTSETVMRAWRRFKSDCNPFKNYYRWDIEEKMNKNQKEYIIKRR